VTGRQRPRGVFGDRQKMLKLAFDSRRLLAPLRLVKAGRDQGERVAQRASRDRHDRGRPEDAGLEARLSHVGPGRPKS